MIEGVTKLAWIAALDRMKRRHGYDCDTCQSTTTKRERRTLKCGWMRRDQHVEVKHSTWGVIGGSYEIPETCPGYTVRLPVVQDVARLWGWEKRRCLDVQLRARQIEPTPLELDLLDIFSAECGRAEAWEMDERIKDKG